MSEGFLKFCKLVKPDTRSGHCLKSHKATIDFMKPEKENKTKQQQTSNKMITQAYQ